MSQPAIGYLDPVFVEMMEELKSLLRYVYQTKNALTFPLSGPGSVGMEYCFVNMVAPGDKVDRLPERRVRRPHDRERRALRRHAGGGRGQVGRAGRSAEGRGRAEEEPGRARSSPSCTPRPRPACQSDAKLLTQIAHKYDAMVIVDAVTSLAGTPVQVDEWEIDAIYSASQKCLSCTPGLSPVSFSERVVEHVKSAQGQDPQLVHGHEPAARLLGRDGTRTYHHTAPTNSLFALHEALLLIREEGLENAWARHHAPSPRAQGRARSDGHEVPGRRRSTSCRR